MLTWVRRHKGKFLLLGAAVAGSYVGGRWLLERVGELREKRVHWEQEEVRLQRHCENHRLTCLSAVLGLLPRLREAVRVQLDAESITAELRTRTSGKVPLWENLKIISFARVVVGVYVCCAVCTLLRVQLSVLGGEFTQRDQTSGSEQQYLKSVQHLLREGLRELVERVRLWTEKVLVSYSLRHQLSSGGVVQLLTDIRSLSASPSHSTHTTERSFLVPFLLPSEGRFEAADVAGSTRDIVESVDFSVVLEGCVDHAFSLLSHQISESHHSAVQSESTLPVARVIPLITDMFDVIFSSQHHSLVQEVVASPELHKLSQNIFEAFSQPSE